MKNLSILFSAMLLSYSSIAQDSKFEFGIQAGPNITNMRYTSEIVKSSMYPQIAGTAGLFFQYNINKTVALRVDPGFERLADKTDEITLTDEYGNSTGTTGKIHFHYDYITIPILARVSIGNQVKFFLNAGPSIGILLNQSSISDYSSDQSKTNNTAYYQTMNYGITSGIGVALPIKETFALSFELRNNFGLTNINVNTNSDFAIKTTATSLLIGFSYKFGKSTTTTKETFSPTF